MEQAQRLFASIDRWIVPVTVGLFLVLIVPSMPARLVLTFVIVLYFWFRFCQVCIVILFCALCFVTTDFERSYPSSYVSFVGVVSEVKENSYLVTNGFQTVWVMKKDRGIQEDDIVFLDCDVQSVHSLSNRVRSTLELYAKNRRIQGITYDAKPKIRFRINSLRKRVHQLIDSKPEKVRYVMELFLLRYHTKQDVFGVLLSSGMHISWFLHQWECFVALFLNERYTRFAKWLMLFLLVFLYPFQFFMHRIMLVEMIRLRVSDSKKKFYISTLLLMVWYPSMVNDMAFLLPVGMSMFHVYQKRHSAIASLGFVASLQLYFQGSFYWIQYLVSMCCRPLFSWMWMLCFLNIWLDLDVLFPTIYKALLFMEQQSWMMNEKWIGKPGVGVLFLMVICLLQYNQWRKRKYLFYFVMLLLFTRYQSFFKPYAIVTYLDVGQGDSTLIQLPFHQGVILIDAAGNYKEDIAKEVLIPVLDSYGIDTLDMLLLTHQDYDHVGSSETLMKSKSVRQLIKEKKKQYQVGDFVLYDLSSTTHYEDENANSLSTLYRLYDCIFLQSGDLGVEQENQIIRDYDDLKVDILKLSHHGSNTSSALKFLQKTNPKLAIVSAGYQNLYHHPSSEVVERLQLLHIPYVNTASQGAINVYVYPWFSYMVTNRGTYAQVFVG